MDDKIVLPAIRYAIIRLIIIIIKHSFCQNSNLVVVNAGPIAS